MKENTHMYFTHAYFAVAAFAPTVDKTKHITSSVCPDGLKRVSQLSSFPCSDKPKRFKTRNIGEKKQDHLPMIQATHGNSFDSRKKKHSINLQVMPSWRQVSWNKCSLGHCSMKLQIPHGDIPVFCFTDAGTVSVGATTWFWTKHRSKCFRNKTGCQKPIFKHTSRDLKNSKSLTSTWPLKAITTTPQRTQDETDKMPTRYELSWWPPTSATMCDCVQGWCMRRPAHDWTDESNPARHHMLLNVLARFRAHRTPHTTQHLK